MKRTIISIISLFVFLLIPVTCVQAGSRLDVSIEQYNFILEENKMLKEDLKNAELAMLELNSIVQKLGLELERSDSLRSQAENSLDDIRIYNTNLEEILSKKSGPKVGLMIGGIYLSGEFGVIAGFSLNF